jgi:hypothetical protein
MVMNVLEDACSLIESLSGPYMIKCFEQIRMKMIGDCLPIRYGFTYCVLSSVALIA